MNTQNTPVHVRLWHRDFWLMAFASLLLTMTVYMLVPAMPAWLTAAGHLSPRQTGLAMGAFAVGLYFLGAPCSWLVQHYRRNEVCLWAIAALTADIVLLWYLDTHRSWAAALWVLLAQRFLLGAAFGLAHMVLASTLIIDTCESHLRTEANHSAAWFSRLALALGPLAGLAVGSLYGFQGVVAGAVACAVLAMLCVKWVDFPFRTPEEGIHLMSLDRFFLPHGFPLFVNLLPFTIVVGLLLSWQTQTVFYVFMLAGFVLALLAQRFVFRDAELKSEAVSGLILMLMALLVLLTSPASPVAPILTGLSVGIIGSRFLLFFIKLSRHCQRGTSQSTFFLGWETGIALGIGAGCMLQEVSVDALLYTALALTAAALLMYHFFTHNWFMHNKNR